MCKLLFAYVIKSTSKQKSSLSKKNKHYNVLVSH
jgi:hypothetical protein